MDYRTESFARRFKSAKAHLGSHSTQELISLKHRDWAVSSSEYRHFIDDYLTRTVGLEVAGVDGDFGGQAWLVKDKAGNRVILVEHETGLEVLGAIGSLASLIALLPMISSGWTKLKHRFFPPHFDRSYPEGIEIRRFDQNNILRRTGPQRRGLCSQCNASGLRGIEREG